MKRKIILGVVAALLVIAGLSVYLAVRVGGELLSARSVLTSSIATVTSAQIEQAIDHLNTAQAALDGTAADILRFVPVARQNVEAIDESLDALGPVLDDAVEVREALNRLRSRRLVEGGVIQLDLLEAFKDPARRQVESLQHLETTLDRVRTGWLIPPIWDSLTTLRDRTDTLDRTARHALDGIALAQSMLGPQQPRTYLVLLMNNAELRGAGGILSSIGTVSAHGGRVSLGRFRYQGTLQEDPPYREVPAPADLKRRFGRYWADTTLWVNATASPDVPEVARVASRLYELQTGVRTDGVVLIDPRGIAAMLPPERRIPLVGSDRTIAAKSLPAFVYSGAYEQPNQRERRLALLALGEAAFKAALEGSIGQKELQAIGRAAGGGHIRAVSFDPFEQAKLVDLGITGNINLDTDDGVLITLQNLGADKLDFWMDRSIRHSCEINDDGSARCSTSVTLTNQAPKGLPLFVVQKKGPMYKGYLEIYIPEAAELTGATLDDHEVEIFRQQEDGRTSIGMDVEIEQNARLEASVFYELSPREGPVSISVIPQPLVRPATLEVNINAPVGWRIQSPLADEGRRLMTKVDLIGRVDITAHPREGPPGLTGLWRAFQRFWTEPVF